MKNVDKKNLQTSFVAAVFSEDIEEIKSYISKDIDVNFLDEDGKSLLYNAIEFKNSVEVCKLLILAGADVNFSFNEGVTLWSQIIYYADDVKRFNDERNELAKELIKSGKLNPQEDSYYKRMLSEIESEPANINERLIVGEGMYDDENSSE